LLCEEEKVSPHASHGAAREDERGILTLSSVALIMEFLLAYHLFSNITITKQQHSTDFREKKDQ